MTALLAAVASMASFGQQVVAAVAVGDLDHVAAMAELVDVFFQNDFHLNLQSPNHVVRRSRDPSANFAGEPSLRPAG